MFFGLFGNSEVSEEEEQNEHVSEEETTLEDIIALLDQENGVNIIKEQFSGNQGLIGLIVEELGVVLRRDIDHLEDDLAESYNPGSLAHPSIRSILKVVSALSKKSSETDAIAEEVCRIAFIHDLLNLSLKLITLSMTTRAKLMFQDAIIDEPTSVGKDAFIDSLALLQLISNMLKVKSIIADSLSTPSFVALLCKNAQECIQMGVLMDSYNYYNYKNKHDTNTICKNIPRYVNYAKRISYQTGLSSSFVIVPIEDFTCEYVEDVRQWLALVNDLLLDAEGLQPVVISSLQASHILSAMSSCIRYIQASPSVLDIDAAVDGAAGVVLSEGIRQITELISDVPVPIPLMATSSILPEKYDFLERSCLQLYKSVGVSVEQSGLEDSHELVLLREAIEKTGSKSHSLVHILLQKLEAETRTKEEKDTKEDQEDSGNQSDTLNQTGCALESLALYKSHLSTLSDAYTLLEKEFSIAIASQQPAADMNERYKTACLLLGEIKRAVDAGDISFKPSEDSDMSVVKEYLSLENVF